MPSPLSTEDKISNLKDLNGTLLKQVSAYRLSNTDLEAKVKSLEEKIQESCARLDEVSIEKNMVEAEKYRMEQELMCSKKEVARLELEKENLVKERETLIVDIEKLESSLFESEEKIKDGVEKLLQSQKALALEEEKCHKHHIEISGLLNERELLLSDIRNLHITNEEAQASLAVSYEREKSLENQLSEVRGRAEMSEVQANEAIQSLHSELSDRLKEREGFQMQLKEAWNQIASLEVQREDTISWQKKLESKSKTLELDLLKAHEEHSNMLASLNKERELEKLSFESMLELTNAKTRLLEQELDSVKNLLSTMESESHQNKKVILQLEVELDSLVQEKDSLLQAKFSLEEEVLNLKLSCEKVAYEAKCEIGNIESRFKTLELDFIKVQEDHTTVLASLNKERELEKACFENMVEVANTEARGLDQELNSVKSLLSMAEIEASQHMKRILQLETDLSSLAQEKETLKEANSLLEEEIMNLKCSSDRMAIDMKSEMRKLESQFKALELEYKNAQVEHVNLLDSVTKEKESEKVSLERMLDVAISKSQMLNKELDLARGVLSTVEIEYDRDRERLLQLEIEHSALVHEKEALEVTKSSLENELEHWKSSCEKVASEANCNAEKLESVIVKLESSLSEARESILQRETSVCQLEGDLQELSFHIRKREKLMFMSLPLALASTGSLIGVGIAALLRHSKHTKY